MMWLELDWTHDSIESSLGLVRAISTIEALIWLSESPRFLMLSTLTLVDAVLTLHTSVFRVEQPRSIFIPRWLELALMFSPVIILVICFSVGLYCTLFGRCNRVIVSPHWSIHDLRNQTVNVCYWTGVDITARKSLNERFHWLICQRRFVTGECFGWEWLGNCCH